MQFEINSSGTDSVKNEAPPSQNFGMDEFRKNTTFAFYTKKCI